MNMVTVPSSMGGAKSLPAQLKMPRANPWMRLRLQHPGYGPTLGIDRRGRLRGLGDSRI